MTRKEVRIRCSEAMRGWRTDRGMTVLDVAIKLRKHHSEIVRLESGESVPRVDTLVRFAKACGVAPGQVVSFLG